MLTAHIFKTKVIAFREIFGDNDDCVVEYFDDSVAEYFIVPALSSSLAPVGDRVESVASDSSVGFVVRSMAEGVGVKVDFVVKDSDSEGLIVCSVIAGIGNKAGSLVDGSVGPVEGTVTGGVGDEADSVVDGSVGPVVGSISAGTGVVEVASLKACRLS